MPEIEAFGWRSKKMVSSRLAWATQQDTVSKNSYKTQSKCAYLWQQFVLPWKVKEVKAPLTSQYCQREGFQGCIWLVRGFCHSALQVIRRGKKRNFSASALSEAFFKIPKHKLQKQIRKSRAPMLSMKYSRAGMHTWDSYQFIPMAAVSAHPIQSR